MTAAIPTVEPAELVAGDTWTWTKSFTDYPATTWTLRYYLRSPAGEIAITAAASGSDYLVSVAAATTATYKAGRYFWNAVVTSGSERYPVGGGSFVVKPDPAATGAGFDGRSHARKTLEAIEAVIEGRATKDQSEYSIGSRMLKRTPIEDLLKLRGTYRAEVFAEDQAEAAAKGYGTSRIVVRL